MGFLVILWELIETLLQLIDNDNPSWRIRGNTGCQGTLSLPRWAEKPAAGSGAGEVCYQQGI